MGLQEYQGSSKEWLVVNAEAWDGGHHQVGGLFNAPSSSKVGLKA